MVVMRQVQGCLEMRKVEICLDESLILDCGPRPGITDCWGRSVYHACPTLSSIENCVLGNLYVVIRHHQV